MNRSTNAGVSSLNSSSMTGASLIMTYSLMRGAPPARRTEAPRQQVLRGRYGRVPSASRAARPVGSLARLMPSALALRQTGPRRPRRRILLGGSSYAMCGIAGVIHRDPDHPVSRALLQRLCATLQHRGPDEEGLHVQGPVGLGMRRLSIIDLSGGQQPIFNEDGSKVIVFNGEIYNYRELRRGLIARGHVVRSQSDTETVLHLYEERGPDCVSQLRGMFAFAIWDATQRQLLLARDRFGIKPLYVVEAPWGIAFASELKALHAAGLTSRALDWEALDMFMQLGYIPTPASPFQDVRKLEPGHTLVWSTRREGVVRRYWHLPRERTPRPAAPEARIREWVDESV